ncbi:unnamed protein product, partial [Heterotrigona itama]
MRRPLIRHLSEGGGGAGDNTGSRRQQSVKEDDRASYTWNCREYGHHLSSCDLLKVPTALGCRGHTTSPEPRIAIHSYVSRWRRRLAPKLSRSVHPSRAHSGQPRSRTEISCGVT